MISRRAIRVNSLLHFDLFERAEEFRSYKLPFSKSPDWPRYFLLCKAVELVLKAYIAAYGRETFGNDLKRLLNKAMKLGLTISPTAQEEILASNDTHKKNRAHYPKKEEARQVYGIEQLEKSVDELFDAVRLKIKGPTTVPSLV
jgi:HEPN domain-containing protein